jgi:hypothetical protein
MIGFWLRVRILRDRWFKQTCGSAMPKIATTAKVYRESEEQMALTRRWMVRTPYAMVADVMSRRLSMVGTPGCQSRMQTCTDAWAFSVVCNVYDPCICRLLSLNAACILKQCLSIHDFYLRLVCLRLVGTYIWLALPLIAVALPTTAISNTMAGSYLYCSNERTRKSIQLHGQFHWPCRLQRLLEPAINICICSDVYMHRSYADNPKP